MPGRWDEARQPNEQESKASLLCSVQIESASAKIRTGGPIDDKDDYQLDVWAGVVPLREQMMTPVSDLLSPREIVFPNISKSFGEIEMLMSYPEQSTNIKKGFHDRGNTQSTILRRHLYQ